MAVQPILSTDKLQSGFRAKYNSSVNEIIISATDNGDGTAALNQYDSTNIQLDLTTSFFTKSEITALLAGLVPVSPVLRVEFQKTGDINGEIDLSLETTIPEFPMVILYPTAGGVAQPASFDPVTLIISGIEYNVEYLIVFIG